MLKVHLDLRALAKPITENLSCLNVGIHVFGERVRQSRPHSLEPKQSLFRSTVIGSRCINSSPNRQRKLFKFVRFIELEGMKELSAVVYIILKLHNLDPPRSSRNQLPFEKPSLKSLRAVEQSQSTAFVYHPEGNFNHLQSFVMQSIYQSVSRK